VLIQLGRIDLDPAEEGGVVDGDAAVGQHAFELPVADRELQVSSHRLQDHLSWEAEAAECPGVGHERRPRIEKAGASAPTRSQPAAQRAFVHQVFGVVA
jgi:hypothetical protein